MRGGSLKSLVTIQQQTEGQDEIGQPMRVWADLAKVWANIRHLSGSEAIKAGMDASTVRASIRIRRRDDVTSAMRVQHKNVVYEISAVMPDEQSRAYVDLVCEIVNG